MKNFEAYEDKIKEFNYDFAIKNGEIVKCLGTCKNCDFRANNLGSCNYNTIKWLYEEYKKPKIKISLVTKVILENLDEKWKWIVRDKNNDVICFENKPVKGKMIWVNNVMGGRILSNLTFLLKNDIFDFLSWEDEEPTSIKELLENCEVI